MVFSMMNFISVDRNTYGLAYSWEFTNSFVLKLNIKVPLYLFLIGCCIVMYGLFYHEIVE